MDSNNSSHSTNVSTDYRYSEQDGDQTSWQLSHTFYNDSSAIKNGVTVGGLNTDTINKARLTGVGMGNTEMSTLPYL